MDIARYARGTEAGAPTAGWQRAARVSLCTASFPPAAAPWYCSPRPFERTSPLSLPSNMTERTDCAPLFIRDRWAGSVSPPATKPPSMRGFGLIMLAGFGVLGGLAIWSGRATGAEWRLAAGGVLIGAGALVFLWSLLSPKTLPPVYRGWMRFGMAIGTVVSTVLLSLLYLFIVAPIGWLMRLTGTDPIERRLRRGPGSYWKAHPPLGGPADYSHMS